MNHAPLLPPGIHDFDESQLDNHFLMAFPNSTTRAPLIEGLRKYIEALRQAGVTFELWIDGSFVSDKENPSDVDLVAFAEEANLNMLPQPVIQYLKTLLDRATAKHHFGCDALFSVAHDQNMRSYWRGWYGFDRNEQPKGIARIIVNP